LGDPETVRTALVHLTAMTEPVFSVFIPGEAIPQGSKNIGRNRRTGRATMYEQAGESLTVWRNTVWVYARQAMRRRPQLTGPVRVEMEFVLHRAAKYAKTATPPATCKPDWDKLARAVGDAMSRNVYVDDAQVVSGLVTKRVAELGESEGLHLTVWDC
jgi:Holliday junction resolvase RusA-like endonuclease